MGAEKHDWQRTYKGTDAQRRERQADRMVRILRVWELRKQGKPAEPIADELGVSYRTVYRDMNVIKLYEAKYGADSNGSA